MASKSPDPDDPLSLKQQIAELQARLAAAQRPTVSGSGAAAQGGGDALGERSAKRAGSNFGSINTGTRIINHYHAATSTGLSKEAIAQRVGGYLSWLRDRTQSIELRGIERALAGEGAAEDCQSRS